jgi:sugar phosphate isomerase/epimerase
MAHKLGLQLYSLRQQLAENFEKTLEKVALYGYEGVELAGLHKHNPAYVAQLLTNLNLKPIAMHCDLLSEDGLKHSLDDADALYCKHLICPWCPPVTFESEKGIAQLAEKLNKANDEMKSRGKSLHYHNHDFEFQIINGKNSFELFTAQLDASICLEIDLYLATVGGANPIELFQNHSDRIKLLHLKDGAISPPNPNTAIGDGNMNYQPIFTAIPPLVSWLFVELEDCATDIMEALKKSVENLKDKIINDYPHNVQRILNRGFAPSNPLTFLP